MSCIELLDSDREKLDGMVKLETGTIGTALRAWMSGSMTPSRATEIKYMQS